MRFIWALLRGAVLIVALCAFVPFLSGLLFGVGGGEWGAAAILFAVASGTLIVTTPKGEITCAIEADETIKRGKYRSPDWSLITYCVITGLGYSWTCAFLLFSRRYAFFSPPIIAATTLVLTLYVGVGFAVSFLTGANWRTALVICALAPGILGSMVLRLGLIR